MHLTLIPNRLTRLCFSISIVFLFMGHHSKAEGESWNQKTEKKAAQRWTLQEWLQQKDRNRWMDQWLQMHTPTPYEFALELASVSYTISSDDQLPQHKTVSGSFIAYASLVGLEFQNNNNASEGIIDNTGLFHMRLLGAADQGTHLTMSLGQQTRHYNNTDLPLRSQYLGQIDLTLYFNHHFGFKLLHKGFYPLKNDPDFGDINGYFESVDAFIDFAALRLFGGAYIEKETDILNGLTTHRNIEGAHAGLRLYF